MYRAARGELLREGRRASTRTKRAADEHTSWFIYLYYFILLYSSCLFKRPKAATSYLYCIRGGRRCGVWLLRRLLLWLLPSSLCWWFVLGRFSPHFSGDFREFRDFHDFHDFHDFRNFEISRLKFTELWTFFLQSKAKGSSFFFFFFFVCY